MWKRLISPRIYNNFRRGYTGGRYSQYVTQEGGGSGARVRLLRPAIWATAFTAGTFFVYADSCAKHREKLTSASSGLFGRKTELESMVDRLSSDPAVQTLIRGFKQSVAGESHAKAIHRIAHLPGFISLELKQDILMYVNKWYGLTKGERRVYSIAALNAVVFGMWQIPRLLPVMARCFLHDPRNGLSYTMLTSTFSHKELWHYAANTIGLVSFGPVVANAMGSDQFTAFYLSSGVLSSLANHLFLSLRPALILPSLGASGAVYSVVGAAAMMFPTAQVSIILLPFIPFTLSMLFPALMTYDLVGAVLGWQSFGHAAHFSGGLFGVAYTKWGREYWQHLVKEIERIRA